MSKTSYSNIRSICDKIVEDLLSILQDDSRREIVLTSLRERAIMRDGETALQVLSKVANIINKMPEPSDKERKAQWRVDPKNMSDDMLKSVITFCTKILNERQCKHI